MELLRTFILLPFTGGYKIYSDQLDDITETLVKDNPELFVTYDEKKNSAYLHNAGKLSGEYNDSNHANDGNVYSKCRYDGNAIDVMKRRLEQDAAKASKPAQQSAANKDTNRKILQAIVSSNRSAKRGKK